MLNRSDMSKGLAHFVSMYGEPVWPWMIQLCNAIEADDTVQAGEAVGRCMCLAAKLHNDQLTGSGSCSGDIKDVLNAVHKVSHSDTPTPTVWPFAESLVSYMLLLKAQSPTPI